MLVLIGLEWAGAQSKKGECRLFKDDDFVRLEIETAIGRRIPVIPVLLESAELPTKDQLPASIQPLLHYHWIRLNPEPEFSIGLSRLRDAICVHMPERRGKRTELLRRYLLISPARNRVAARSKAVFYVMLFFSLTAIAGVISPAPFNIGVTDDLAMMTRTDALFSAVLFIPMTLFLALRQIRCAVYHKCLDEEFEFRLVESEEFEDEVLLISVPVSGSLESSDFVVDSFHGTARDRIVIPIENSRSVALQSVGHSLKDANTCCSRASAPVIEEDGGRCLASLSPDLSEVFLEVVTDVK
jgi:hypothetical protein